MFDAFTQIDMPLLCGIYLLVDGDEIIYVGQSVDIHARLADHRRTGKAFGRALFLAVAESDLDAYEGALIRAFRPRLSKNGPRDSSRDREILTSLGLERLLPPKTEALPPKSEFGDAVRRIRTAAGMSMHEFAKRIGTSASNVCEWESGKHGAPLRRVRRIAAEFGVDVSELLNAEGRERPYLSLGARIKAARKSVGLKQSDLAERLKITNTAVSHWENGWSRPDRESMVELAGIVGPLEAKAS